MKKYRKFIPKKNTFKISALTLNDEFELPDGDHIWYQIFKSFLNIS